MEHEKDDGTDCPCKNIPLGCSDKFLEKVTAEYLSRLNSLRKDIGAEDGTLVEAYLKDTLKRINKNGGLDEGESREEVSVVFGAYLGIHLMLTAIIALGAEEVAASVLVLAGMSLEKVKEERLSTAMKTFMVSLDESCVNRRSMLRAGLSLLEKLDKIKKEVVSALEEKETQH